MLRSPPLADEGGVTLNTTEYANITNFNGHPADLRGKEYPGFGGGGDN